MQSYLEHLSHIKAYQGYSLGPVVNPGSQWVKIHFFLKGSLFTFKNSFCEPSCDQLQELRRVLEERQLRRQLKNGAKAQDVVTLDVPGRRSCGICFFVFF